MKIINKIKNLFSEINNLGIIFSILLFILMIIVIIKIATNPIGILRCE